MVSEDGEILSYILRMPKQHQEVLILYYYDEFSTKEIGSREKKCRNRCQNQPEKGWMIC